MSMNYSPALDSATYLQNLQAFMKAVEGEKLTVYVDSTGNPTIGWGFALNTAHLTTVNALYNIIETVLGVDRNRGGLSQTAKGSELAYRESLKTILNQSWARDLTANQTGPSTRALQAALKAKLDQRAADIAAHRNGYTVADQIAIGTLATTFAYSTVDQIAATFGIIKPVIEGRLNTALGTTVPETYERIALFTMQYLGAMGSRMKGLLNTALNLSDPNAARAEVWYSIRYLNKAGWEQRSYMEAAMFSLYPLDASGSKGSVSTCFLN